MTRDEVLKECVKELEPILGARAKLLWLKYLNARNPEQKQKWKRRIQLLGEHVTRSFEDEVKLRPPSPEQSKGEYQLGKIIYPDKDYSDFGLREDEWCKHMLIAGMTGSGKTNTAFKIIGELKKKNIRFLVFDWSREYKKLRKKYEDILVVKASDGLKFNPLIPPRGTSPKEWMMKLCDVVNHAYLGSYGTEFMMRNVIDKAYKQAGVYDGKKVYPTFSIVKYYAKSGGYKGRIDLWSQTLLRILDSLTFAGGLGNITLTSKNTNIGALLKRDLILELDTLSENDKVFLTEALILWIYEYRKNQGITDKLRHVIIIEEAHNILSKKKERQKGAETIMEATLRTIRKFGEGVIVIDQEPSKLSESMKANTYTKICFNLGNGKDIEEIARSMGLTRKEKEYIDKLRIGQAIIKLKGRFTQPVLVEFPLIKLENTWEVTP